MKKVLIDTNVVIDVLTSRQPWHVDGEKIFIRIANNEIQGCISASSITDIFYLLNKYSKTRSVARKAIENILDLFTILDVTPEDCINALGLGIEDYEDALIIIVAVRHKIDLIITRNVKDFELSPIEIVTPNTYIKM
ncbi:PIN domain-containing protein [Acidaminobacter sp. JC074]|uniref:type II toxin-antitoxin system VapC family toxin n=1 Tax=Acidaminobacter sp. JC074 TaxID=2530199 RepID=UPI001F0EB316|nr:PIN domain-containing protein [Acidaminobacter sp. JC074]MCH4888818.1 PIN domain-containing protein [Acidaminobacter sp. JC074]